MRALDYALRHGWESLWRAKGASSFAIVAIALAMTVLGALLLLTWNADRALSRWMSAAEFSVYLVDTATSEQRGAIEAVIDESGATAGREFVSKAQALTRFRREFTELATLTTGFDDNPFPASLEVRVQSEAERDGRAEALVARVRTMPGVADVRYDRDWLATFSRGIQGIRRAGMVLGLIMALAAGVTVAAVVRLGLHARRDEIEIMELVGAPLAFIRGPFVAEGLLQGGLGAAVATLVLLVGVFLARTAWGTDLSTMVEGAVVEFPPAWLWVSLLAGGMGVGAVGGFAAAHDAG